MVSAMPVALVLGPRSLKQEIKTRYTFATEDGEAT